MSGRAARVLLGGFFLLAGSSFPLQAQNLVTNPTFDTNVNPWFALSGNLAFDPSLDVNGSASSGSAKCTNNQANPLLIVFPLTECVNGVAPNTTYDFGVSVIIPSGQTVTGLGYLAVLAYSVPNCGGSAIGNQATPPIAPVGTWQLTKGTFTTPPGTVSALLEAGEEKIEAGGSLQMNFDNAFLQPASVLEIPALDTSGRVALLLALACAAVVTIRRLRG